MTEEHLYKKFAQYYDKIYSKKNYNHEADFIKWAVKNHSKTSGKKLLDIACGTGSHAILLQDDFDVLGIDINTEMLDIARAKVAKANFQEGDMKNLDFDPEVQSFDVVICMFSAINYSTTYLELKKTLQGFYETLEKGGVLIFDLGLNKENWVEGRVSVDTVVEDNLELARIGQPHMENGVFNANFVFLVKKDGEIDFNIDQHQMGVFETTRVLGLMDDVGFKTMVYDEFTSKLWDTNSRGRPVFVGVK